MGEMVGTTEVSWPRTLNGTWQMGRVIPAEQVGSTENPPHLRS